MNNKNMTTQQTQWRISPGGGGHVMPPAPR